MPPRKYQNQLNDRGLTLEQLDVVHASWVLKKKRKKMQGYAKRYLILTKQGLLTYSLSPEKPTRDSIEIPHASVTSSKRHGTLHVDSGSSVFHIKALSPQDFEAWRAHLKSFIPDTNLPGDVGGQRIYVGANNGTELQAVDLSPVFTSSHNLKTLVAEAQSKMNAIKEKEQGGLLSSLSLMPKGNDDSLASLAVLIDQIAAEHGNLQFALDSKIPRGGADGTMNSLRSTRGHLGNASRMSISSFHTVPGDEATFFDADTNGADDEQFRSDSTAETTDDDDDSDGDSDGKTLEASGGVGGDGRGRAGSVASAAKGGKVKYRTELPAKVSGDEVSLFSMLKKNVGKDLSTVSFPVSFNCPLSLLQASAEEFEYAPDLLERAAKCHDDWVERICLVGAFAVSGYACTKLRASRKPFNPLLGETYECVREEQNLRFIAEKVVHQPPVVAFYAEGKGWHSTGWSAVKNKFWGKSLELIPEGTSRLEFDDGDSFTFQKPSSFMRNLLAGNKYLEHVGELVVTNNNTGQRLVIEFKEGNMWGGSGSRNQVVGTVYDENGQSLTSLKGKWTDSFARQRDAENYQVLWECAEMPPRAEEYYGFTYFAMSLNEITPDIKDHLPPTDTRFRPDQKAFEEGDVDKAEELKAKLESEQRERRKAGKAGEPQWFHKEEGGDGWAYGGQGGQSYFKARAKGDGEAWKGSPKLW